MKFLEVEVFNLLSMYGYMFFNWWIYYDYVQNVRFLGLDEW